MLYILLCSLSWLDQISRLELWSPHFLPIIIVKMYGLTFTVKVIEA